MLDRFYLAHKMQEKIAKSIQEIQNSRFSIQDQFRNSKKTIQFKNSRKTLQEQFFTHNKFILMNINKK